MAFRRAMSKRTSRQRFVLSDVGETEAPTNIGRSALGMIEAFGNNALEQALVQVRRMTDKGDRQGETVWSQIVAAIEAVQKYENSRP